MTLKELLKELRLIAKVHPDAMDHTVRLVGVGEKTHLLRFVGYDKKRKAILLEDE